MNDTLIASTDPFASSLAGRKLGRYEVLARLASGGMAGVYVARAIGVAGFERLFAIKVLHPHLAHEEEFISMFLDEARLAARIRHPNVVPTIDISDTPDAGFYLVMEYIEGDHLGALLQKAWKLGKRLPFPVTLRILVDALEGLAAAHNLTDEAGRHLQLVHRDVSPHNIMVSTDGIARLTDFGVAKAEVRLSTTREGQFKGKLAYMAPEHASDGDADQRSDLFSMAIILWESLAGRRLFRAENHAATLNKICLEPIPLLSSADPGLAPFDALLAKALARDPNGRFQSAEEFAEAIEETAPLLGGLAKAREVAQLVREYAAEKISHDAHLIRSAIAQLAATGHAGKYSVITTRDIEKDEQFDHLGHLPMIKGIAPINRLLLPEELNSDMDLRKAAAVLHADMLLIYTLDTTFHTRDEVVPLTVITLGLSPNQVVHVISTASAILIDTRNGYLYGYAEATEKTDQLTSGWTKVPAIDAARRRAEEKAFDKLTHELEKTLGKVANTYASARG